MKHPIEAMQISLAANRAKVNEFIRSLGFDPNEISHVEITPRAIYLMAYMRNELGEFYVLREGGNVRVATETYHVDITEAPEVVE